MKTSLWLNFVINVKELGTKYGKHATKFSIHNFKGLLKINKAKAKYPTEMGKG